MEYGRAANGIVDGIGEHSEVLYGRLRDGIVCKNGITDGDGLIGRKRRKGKTGDEVVTRLSDAVNDDRTGNIRCAARHGITELLIKQRRVRVVCDDDGLNGGFSFLHKGLVRTLDFADGIRQGFRRSDIAFSRSGSVEPSGRT